MVLAGCGGGGVVDTASGVPSGGGGGGVATKSASLSWSSVTFNDDGTPLVDLAGFKVYYGTQSGNYTNSTDISDPSTTSTVVSGLTQDTTYYFAVTAYDTSGNESSFSNEVIK
ncbi:MAG: fibronectin type III domain-containing protein [Deltaproteobacteria bacterium]|nr:fibronectin type III domain-containing protein [Deltaproteobacteria bacterium]